MDEYIETVKKIEGDGLPFLEYVKLSKLVEFFDKTRWGSESLTFAHVVVCELLDSVGGSRLGGIYWRVCKWDIEKKLDFCAYLRNVYYVKHRIYLEFADWIKGNYSLTFGKSFGEVVDMFLDYCIDKYNCELEDVDRFEKVYGR